MSILETNPTDSIIIRNNRWLATQLSHIHQTYFVDIPIANQILVRFGRSAVRRLGSITTEKHPIKPEERVTVIRITSLFKDTIVPEYVIQATLAHELAHYSHGFHSPLPQKYKDPHRGGVVDKEIMSRGAGHLLEQQNIWLHTEYRSFLRRKGHI